MKEKDIDDFNYYINNPEYSPQLEYIFFHCAENKQEILDFYQKNTKDRAKSSVVNVLFPHTNEGFTEFYRKMKAKHKHVLTTGSSGDQALIAILNGAKNVTIADLNMYTKMWTELKIAGIKNLSYHDFCTYFKFHDPFYKRSSFEYNFYKYPKVYAVISHSLPSDVQNFWDTMMLEGYSCDFNALNIAKEKIDYENIPYLFSESKYYRLQNILRNNKYKINYVVDELSNFPKRVNEKYDFIDLSNIVDYYICNRKYDNNEKSSQAFLDVVDHLYNKNLNTNGSIRVTTAYERLANRDEFVSNLNQKYGKKNVSKLHLTGLFGIYDSLMVKKSDIDNKQVDQQDDNNVNMEK